MKSIAGLLLIPLLTACALSGPAVEKQSFLIAPEHREAKQAASAAAKLRLGAVEVASPFAGRGFVYRRDEVRFETDFYNEFAADPGNMLAAAAAEWLAGSGLFREIQTARTRSPADYRLEASVPALYVDFRGAVPEAVLSVRWRLMRERDDQIQLGVDCDQRVPLTERTPRGAALAYKEALKQALAKLETSLRAGELN